MDEASFCDQLLLLREGAVIAAETPQRLLAETGASDLAGAFLELIKRKEAGA